MAPVRNSERRDKFVRLAERRTVNAIKAIRVLAKLGNKSAYDFDDGDAKKIVNALQREVDSLKTKMSAKVSKAEIEFKLEDTK